MLSLVMIGVQGEAMLCKHPLAADHEALVEAEAAAGSPGGVSGESQHQRNSSQRERSSELRQSGKWQCLALVGLCLGVAAVGPTGCKRIERKPSAAKQNGDGFWIASVKLDPAFSKTVAPSAESGESARLEVVVQLRDQFGDPLKGLGKFRFELFKYRPAHSDVRGQRLKVDGSQLIDLSEITANQEHWDSIMRAYRMVLPLPVVGETTGQLVLQVTFIAAQGYRLEDHVVLELGG